MPSTNLGMERFDDHFMSKAEHYPPDPEENKTIAELRIKLDVRTIALRYAVAYGIAITGAFITLIATFVLHAAGVLG